MLQECYVTHVLWFHDTFENSCGVYNSDRICSMFFLCGNVIGVEIEGCKNDEDLE
jgi:hypothetical protein